MIVLPSADRHIDIELTAGTTTNPVHCYASYRDVSDSSDVFLPGAANLLLSASGDTTLIAAPASGRQRVIDYISIFNADTANAEVSIQYHVDDAVPPDHSLFKVTLATGEKLEYTDAAGFVVIGNNGAQKNQFSTGSNAVSSALQQLIITSPVVNNNATANTMQDVTGLSFAVNSGLRYYFEFMCFYTSAATSTGSRWSIQGPATPTELRYRSEYSFTTTSRTVNDSLTAYDQPASSNATSGATGANIAIIQGIITPSANGIVIARFASEVSASAITALPGSKVMFQQLT